MNDSFIASLPITTLRLPTLLPPTLLLLTLLLLTLLLLHVLLTLLTAHAAAGLVTPRRCCLARLRLSLARPGSFARHVWSRLACGRAGKRRGRAGTRTCRPADVQASGRARCPARMSSEDEQRG